MLFWLFFIFSDTFRTIFFICLSIGIIIVIGLIIKYHKNKKIMLDNLLKDERFINSKTFISENHIPVIVSESGFIAIADHFLNSIKIVNIKDVNGIELQINNNRKAIETIGLSLGSISGNFDNIGNKINSIKILIKINDFNNPILEIPFISREIDVNSDLYKNISEEINKLMGTLEYLNNKYIRGKIL